MEIKFVFCTFYFKSKKYNLESEKKQSYYLNNKYYTMCKIDESKNLWL